MIKGNNQNVCEHNKQRDGMGYCSPTGNDWALTGGWLNKSHSYLQYLMTSSAPTSFSSQQPHGFCSVQNKLCVWEAGTHTRLVVVVCFFKTTNQPNRQTKNRKSRNLVLFFQKYIRTNKWKLRKIHHFFLFYLYFEGYKHLDTQVIIVNLFALFWCYFYVLFTVYYGGQHLLAAGNTDCVRTQNPHFSFSVMKKKTTENNESYLHNAGGQVKVFSTKCEYAQEWDC